MSYPVEIIKESNPNYCNQLKELLESIENWDNHEKFELKWITEEFMDRLWELYLDHFQFHQNEAKLCLLDYEGLLLSHLPDINKYYASKRIFKVESADEYQDRWDIACNFRSRTEAFNDLFGHLTGRLEDEELVEFVERRKKYIDDGVPREVEKVPKSHWWWFVGFSW